ncbi:hypothetical protein [Blastomonas sp.]|uniref:hypothetical protein n=1 Tax=Blastomonas sp. TaxID=1909299 RepID=UPI00391BB8CF
MTDWDFDTHRARLARDRKVVRRLGYMIMAISLFVVIGVVAGTIYIATTVSPADIARKAGELTRTFEDAKQ